MPADGRPAGLGSAVGHVVGRPDFEAGLAGQQQLGDQPHPVPSLVVAAPFGVVEAEQGGQRARIHRSGQRPERWHDRRLRIHAVQLPVMPPEGLDALVRIEVAMNAVVCAERIDERGRDRIAVKPVDPLEIGLDVGVDVVMRPTLQGGRRVGAGGRMACAEEICPVFDPFTVGGGGLVRGRHRMDEPAEGPAVPVEEEIRGERPAEHHVVVGVEEPFGQAGYPPQEVLDRHAVERRQELPGHELALPDDA